MQFIGIFKRVFPFFLTFTAGLFIASFFVSLSAPKFNWNSRSWNKRSDCKRVRSEIRELRDENIRLRMQLEEAASREALKAPENTPAKVVPMKTVRIHESPPPPPEPRAKR